MIKSKLDNGVREVELDMTEPEDLVGCSYSLPIVDYVKCPNCEKVVPNETEDEYEITDVKDDILKINENEENQGEFSVGKMNFDPIEYGTIIEGNGKVVNIIPSKECSLKLNLT